MSKNILGIDVSKRKLDVALVFNERTLIKTFDNSSKGCQLLAAWLKTLHLRTVHVYLESTGIYGDLVAQTMHDLGHFVSIVNPLHVKAYGVSKRTRLMLA
jgi:transposase